MSSWPNITIEDLCVTIVDCVNRTAPVVEGPTPYRMIRTTNVRDGFIDLRETRYVDEQTYKQWTRRQVPMPGDVVLTREAPLGEVGLIRPGEHVFLGQRLVSYRTNPELLDNRYLLYFLLSEQGKSQVLSFGMGATVEHMRVPDAKKLQIPCPPIETQRRIASILGAYDDLIEVNRRRIAVLEEMGRRLFEEWFFRLRFPGNEPMPILRAQDGPLPMGWKQAPLGSLFAHTTGGLWGEASATETDNQRVSVIRGTDFPKVLAGRYAGVPHRFVSNRELAPRALAPGDLILEASGGSKDQPVGRVLYVTASLVNKLCPPIAPASFCRLLRPIDQAGTGTYIYGLLQAMYQDKKIEKFQKQSTGLRNLSMRQLAAETVTVPDAKTLALFDKATMPLLETASFHRHECRALGDSRDLLLPRLISGQLSLAEAERQLEEAA